MQSLPGEAGVFTGVDRGGSAPKIVLTIAGFDPSSGAGFTADLKVFAAYGLYGLACPTALTVQSTIGVVRSESCSAQLVSETLHCLAEDFQIDGVKIGMLGTAAVVSAVVDWLRPLLRRRPALPVVLDPVLRSSSGAELLDEAGLAALRTGLLPLASAVTPNFEEAAVLAGESSENALREPGSVEDLAKAVLRAAHHSVHQGTQPGSYSSARERSSPAIVITGGHAGPGTTPDDYLLAPSATLGEPPQGSWFRGQWVQTRSTHGTGCAFSSALLCGLVQGLTIQDATAGAKAYVHAALQAAYPLGRGKGPLNHLFRFGNER